MPGKGNWQGVYVCLCLGPLADLDFPNTTSVCDPVGSYLGAGHSLWISGMGGLVARKLLVSQCFGPPSSVLFTRVAVALQTHAKDLPTNQRILVIETEIICMQRMCFTSELTPHFILNQTTGPFSAILSIQIGNRSPGSPQSKDFHTAFYLRTFKTKEAGD